MGQTVSVSFGGRLAWCGAAAGWRVVNLTKILVVSFLNLMIFNPITTFSDGCLGSSNDEGRSKMR
tara:strand:+ start:99 stop:293 length:195 start_codon:yes stop_codon:yes gene_type:complete